MLTIPNLWQDNIQTWYETRSEKTESIDGDAPSSYKKELQAFLGIT